MCVRYSQSKNILTIFHNVLLQRERRKNSSFVLDGSNRMTKAGSNSRYLRGETKQMRRSRVKLTYTLTTADISAPIFVSIVGLPL